MRTSPTLARRPARAIRLGLACTLLPVVCAIAFQVGFLRSVQLPADLASGAGAAALASAPLGDQVGAVVDHVDVIVPDPALARDDIADVYDGRKKCITGDKTAQLRRCVFGDPNSAYTVALVGDSHAAQWLPALDDIGRSRHWKIITYIKSSCPFIAVEIVDPDGRPFTTCTAWNRSMTEELTGAGRPDLAIMSSAGSYRVFQGGIALSAIDSEPVKVDAWRAAWSSIASPETVVAVIRDTPRPETIDVPECVASNLYSLSTCGFDRATALSWATSQDTAVAGLSGVYMVNLNDAICPTAICAPVIGGVLVYRDNNHITATYAHSLAPRLNADIDRILESVASRQRG